MKHQRHHQWVQCLTFIIIGCMGSVLLSCHMAAFTPPDTIPPNAAPDFRLMAEAWNTVERVYVDRKAVNPQLMTYGAISGMVNALGDTGHSRFLTPDMVKQERNLAKGTFEGIGAEVQMKNNQVVIVAPLDDSPAQRAGLKPGDIILKVDEKDVSGLPLEQVVSRILGPPGTKVKLTILNPTSGRTSNITIVRARITLHNVTWHRLPGAAAAHVRIATFSRGVTEDLRKELIDIQREGLTGLILDLRNNPGGLFDEAVNTASQFLRSGNVLLEKNAASEITAVPVQSGGVALTIPMVVLINGGTSSDAEIVAGALRDQHRATLVGEKTFGTGTVLQSFPLSDGSAVLLAIKEWLTPSGDLIWHKGISPDVVVSLPPEVLSLTPQKEKGMTEAKLRASGDLQLLRALDWLTQPPREQAFYQEWKKFQRCWSTDCR